MSVSTTYRGWSLFDVDSPIAHHAKDYAKMLRYTRQLASVSPYDVNVVMNPSKTNVIVHILYEHEVYDYNIFPFCVYKADVILEWIRSRIQILPKEDVACKMQALKL